MEWSKVITEDMIVASFHITESPTKMKLKRPEQLNNKLLEFCKLFLNTGGAELTLDNIVTIIKIVNHDDRCSDLILDYIYKIS